ncbi:MAG TPA: hypothetical protein VG457_03155 [Planctomycetota bacterium]|nr:hypothetical protein [Planctomycetota bacterium]
MTLAMGIYFFAIAYVLAQLEIQIEGPHGWAEKLPTWRWDSPAVLRWAGKPITGYHFYLLTFILLFIHLPLISQGWSVEREGETMSLFFLLAVFWDFLWFVCNPHFGLARFNAAGVWWFKKWVLGLPASYFTGLLLSAVAYAAPGLQAASSLTWTDRAIHWGSVFAVLLMGTLGTVVAHARRRVEVAEIAKT